MGTSDRRKGPAKPGDELRKQFELLLPIALRFLQRRVLLALTVPLAIAGLVLGPRLKPPSYQSEAVLLYRNVLRSDVALGDDSGDGSAQTRGRRLCGMLFSANRLEEIILAEDLYRSVREELGIRDAILELRKDGTCRAGEADTIRIQFRGRDADVVFRVTSRLAQVLIDIAAGEDAERAEKTQDFLEAEERQTTSVLRQKEQARAEFLQEHPEFASEPGGNRSATPAVDHAAALRRQADRLRRQLEAPTPAANAPPSPPPAAPELTPESRAAIARAEAGLSEARERLGQARERFTPQHPDVIAAQNTVARAMTGVEAAKASAQFIDPTPPPAATAGTSTADRERMSRQLAGIEHLLRAAGAAGAVSSAQAGQLASIESQWSELTRELATAQERHSQVASRLFRASILAKATGGGEGSPLVIVDQPYRPTRPSSAGPRRMAALSAALVSAAWWAGILALCLLDDRVQTASEVEQLGLGRFVHVQRRRRRPREQRRESGPVGS